MDQRPSINNISNIDKKPSINNISNTDQRPSISNIDHLYEKCIKRSQNLLNKGNKKNEVRYTPYSYKKLENNNNNTHNNTPILSKQEK